MTVRFNVPPGWPTPPLSWTPSEDWLPDPQWPEPPEGWSFWSPVLEGAGSLSVADRAALEAELDGAESGSYGCTVVTWWSTVGEVTAEDMHSPVVAPVAEAVSEGSPDEVAWVVPVPAVVAPVVAAPAVAPVAGNAPADVRRAPNPPRRKTTTIPRRNLLVAAVIICALGLVGFQASRILLVSDDSDGTDEVPKPLPVSDTRVPTRSTSPSSEAGAPGVVTTTASTDRPDLVAATVVVPSSTSAPSTARTSVPTTTGPTTVASPSTTAPAATKRTATTPSPSRSSATSASSTSASSTTTATPLARPSVTATKTVVAATATAAAAGGDRS